MSHLQRAVKQSAGMLTGLPEEYQLWVSLWELCSSQRYGQGMTTGTLIHSEIWNNLEKYLPHRTDHERIFNVINEIDSIFRELTIKAQDNKAKRGGQGVEGAKDMVAAKEKEMEGKET